VLAAIRAVPRHELVPESMRSQAYDDRPLPIGHEQTISQPFVVALMTQLAAVDAGDKVLEVGTGSGYQAAVLAELGADVYSIEIVEPLGRRADAALRRLGYDVHTRIGDGYRGWPSEAPFDAIVITAAPPEIPQPLLDQLAVGGRMVVPVGPTLGEQRLTVITRTENGFERSGSIPVLFVPMTGEAGSRR
jgi:protein-L-isoaspartate(D-aspartate) O-methyltransferase